MDLVARLSRPPQATPPDCFSLGYERRLAERILWMFAIQQRTIHSRIEPGEEAYLGGSFADAMLCFSLVHKFWMAFSKRIELFDQLRVVLERARDLIEGCEFVDQELLRHISRLRRFVGRQQVPKCLRPSTEIRNSVHRIGEIRPEQAQCRHFGTDVKTAQWLVELVERFGPVAPRHCIEQIGEVRQVGVLLGHIGAFLRCACASRFSANDTNTADKAGTPLGFLGWEE